MGAFPKIVTISLGVLCLYSCSRNIFQKGNYQAPAMGAESRFDEGLKKEKHPQQLFSKKERKDMEKMGTLSKQERSAPNTKISAAQADSLLTGKTADTTRQVPMDSARTMPADTTVPQPVDTTRQ